MSASYAAAKTVVFWDIEDCKIPDGLSAGEVSQNIRTSLANKGYHGTVEIRAYGESKDDFVSAGIKLYHFPAENKDARDKQILVDLYFWAVDNGPEPSNVMLIMGDISQEIPSSPFFTTSLSAGQKTSAKAEALKVLTSACSGSSQDVAPSPTCVAPSVRSGT